MADNTENIEAKLCAYIDGELDAEGRAEIEKHLAGSPQHRRLIEELAQSRELLRGLPRESAPAEVVETLQGQLERSLLLAEDDGDGRAMLLRVSRRPQIMAAAAILLLALGLGMVVYMVLPPAGPVSQTGPLAINQERESAEEMPSVQRDGWEDQFVGDVPARRSESAPAPVVPEEMAEMRELADAGEVEAKPLPRAIATAEGLDRRARSAAPADEAAAGADLLADARVLQQRLTATGILMPEQGGSEQTLYYVVSADDSRSANTDVVNFLASNRIAWQPVEPRQTYEASLHPLRGDQRPERIGAIAQQMLAERHGPAEEGQRIAEQEAALDWWEEILSQVVPPVQVLPRTQVRGDGFAPVEPAGRGRGGGGGWGGSPDEQIIVARGMTRGQAEALGVALSKKGAVKQAVVKDLTHFDRTAAPGEAGMEFPRTVAPEADADVDVPRQQRPAPAPVDSQLRRWTMQEPAAPLAPATRAAEGTPDEAYAGIAEAMGEHLETDEILEMLDDERLDVVIVLQQKLVPGAAVERVPEQSGEEPVHTTEPEEPAQAD